MGEMNDAELAIVRRAFAKQVMGAAGLVEPRIEAAFAAVRREDFLGPGPWWRYQFSGEYLATPDANPVHVYQDALFGIVPEKVLNNGAPSFLALLIASGRPAEGEHAVHIGAGVGYYTAIISHLAGATGHVTAIEYEAELAARATENLARTTNVRVVHGDGAHTPLEPADLIYVNAGASRPAEVWLDALNDGGRLILPLTVDYQDQQGRTLTRGAVFLIERRGAEYAASWRSATGIYPCVGARDEASVAALRAAFDKGGERNVTRLYRGDELADAQCWVRAPGWALAY